MRIAITGASGNAGTALLRNLQRQLKRKPGSLELVATRFPQSRLSLEQMGGAFGEAGLGPLTRLAISGVEGLLFTGCVTAAVLWAWRATRRAPPPA